MAFFARDKVSDLFDREKIMLSPKKDGVPEDKVAEIFGEDAVKRVKEVNASKGITWDSYGSRNCFYRTGFFAAAGYYNVAQLQQEEKGNGSV